MLKKILIYGIGTFFSKILLFIMIPIYTRVLSPADYGYYDVLLSNMQLIVSIAFMEVWSGIIRFMFDEEDPYSPIKTFINLLPLFIVLYLVVFFVFSQFFTIHFPVLIFIYGIAYLFFFVMNSVCRGLGRNSDYVISGGISTVVSCVLNFLFLVVFHRGISYMFFSIIMGYSFGIAYVELRTHAFVVAIRKRSSKNKCKEMLSYCFPLMINTFSYSFLSLFNKNIIMNQLGQAVSGYYAVAEKIAQILSLGISIYQLAWQEEAYSYAKSEQRSEIYSYYFNQFIKSIGLFIPIYMQVCYFIMPLVSGKNFSTSLELIPLFVLQVYISSMSSFLCIIISANKKSMQILASTVFGAVANSVLVMTLIPRFGMLASNISLCVGFFLCAFARYIFANQFSVLKVKPIWSVIIFIEFLISYILFKFNEKWIVLLSIFVLCAVWLVANFKIIKKFWQNFFNEVKYEKTKADNTSYS